MLDDVNIATAFNSTIVNVELEVEENVVKYIQELNDFPAEDFFRVLFVLFVKFHYCRCEIFFVSLHCIMDNSE